MELDTAGDGVRWPYQTVINWKWETEIKIPSRKEGDGIHLPLFFWWGGGSKNLNCLVRKKIVWHALCQLDSAGSMIQSAARARSAVFPLCKLSPTSHTILVEVESRAVITQARLIERQVTHPERQSCFKGKKGGGVISIQEDTNSNLDLIGS